MEQYFTGNILQGPLQISLFCPDPPKNIAAMDNAGVWLKYKNIFFSETT